MVDIGSEGAEVLAVIMARGRQGEGHEGAAVKSAGEGHDGGTPGVGACDLDGVFDGFGTGVEKDGLVRPGATDESAQARGEFDIRLVHGDLEAGVDVTLELSLNGFGDAGMAVADVHDAQAAGEIEILFALGVAQGDALGVSDEDGMGGGNAARHPAIALLQQ